MVAGEHGLTASVRGMRFNDLIADVLSRDGIDAEANVRGPRGEVDVAFAFDGPRYLLEAKWEADPIGFDPIRKLHSMIEERLPGSVGVVLSWSGFNDSALRYAAGTARDVILLDRTHFEAMLTGAASAQEIMSAAHRFLWVLGQEYAPLASMLRPRAGTPSDQVEPGAPTGFVPEAVAAPGGLNAQILLHGTGLQDLAADGDRLVITTPGGLWQDSLRVVAGFALGWTCPGA
jgi:hypothetical protein